MKKAYIQPLSTEIDPHLGRGLCTQDMTATNSPGNNDNSAGKQRDDIESEEEKDEWANGLW